MTPAIRIPALLAPLALLLASTLPAAAATPGQSALREVFKEHGIK